MPITPFLRAKEFDPALIAKMSDALLEACEALGLAADKDDQITQLVAQKIIELAQRGVTDVVTLTEMTIQKFRQAK